MTSIETTGAAQIAANLQRIVDAQTQIARDAAGAGVSVSVQACRSAAPGSIKNEVGGYVKAQGAVATGKAGLMQYPRRGQQGKGPHGVYLDQGTKYITARHFIGQALAGSRAQAEQVMERSVERSIENLVR